MAKQIREKNELIAREKQAEAEKKRAVEEAGLNAQRKALEDAYKAAAEIVQVDNHTSSQEDKLDDGDDSLLTSLVEEGTGDLPVPVPPSEVDISEVDNSEKDDTRRGVENAGEVDIKKLVNSSDEDEVNSDELSHILQNTELSSTGGDEIREVLFISRIDGFP